MSGGVAQSSAPLAPGAEAAPGYKVIEHLRRGRDLDVYDVWSAERGARCVIKALRPDRAGRRSGRRAIEREGALLARLTHPHIVRAYETLHEPIPAVVLETLPGATLSALIDDEPPPTAEDIGHLGLQLASALGYLHRNGVLHLDLKPSNVIVEAGRARLIDLSVARSPGKAPAGVGTWGYLSPEQARGDILGPPADVWGLGATLFEVATGEAPYDDDPDAWVDPPSTATDSASEPTRYPQLERAPRRPEEVGAIDPQAADLVAACLALDPRERPTLAELFARFESLAGLSAAERRWSASADGDAVSALSSPSKVGLRGGS